jgi:Zn-dependent peptidase ImmA (M78 family)/transcriptional regulator with XRE-family HTH domain
MPITSEELARRIKASREAAGLSQETVAQELSIPRSAVAQIEASNRRVSTLELERIAYLVGRSVSDFVQESFDEASTLAALFRIDAKVAGTAPVIEEVRRCLQIGRELTNLERLLGIDRIRSSGASYSLPLPNASWEAVQQGTQVAEEERRRLGLGSSPIANLAEVLEGQGVRTASVSLPGEISGFTLQDPNQGAAIFINGDHHAVRGRYSLAHEYAHVLIDHDRLSLVSRASEGSDMREVRANAFAAAFLLPEEGLLHALERLGKPFSKRGQTAVFGASEQPSEEARSPTPRPEIQIHDLALLTANFGVSAPALVYRLYNLDLLSKATFEELRSRAEVVNVLRKALGIEHACESERADDFRKRFLGLALEAYRREIISRGKVQEVGRLVGMEGPRVEEVLNDAGLEQPPVDVREPHSEKPR